ncbi:MAG: CaiB/BaiF CoA transferase family protein [Anaerolineae bacterium]
MSNLPDSAALSGLLVLDLSRVLAGPYCTMILGDLGAEVIKVEVPGQGDETRQWGPPWAGGESAYYLSANRNKKSITLNLKSERGRDIARELARRADILVENFRTGTMEGWGLGYESLQAINPGLVYCSITGYGPDGPYKDRPGYDFVIQAEGGIMSITGPEEGPPYKVGVAIVDITAALFACIAILAALQERSRSGQGQRIDVSLLESQVAWLANVASNYLVSGERPKRYGNAHPNVVPYEAFETADGYVTLGIGNDRQYQTFCREAGCEYLAEDPRFATNPDRVQNRATLIPLLQEVFRRKTTEEWIRLFFEMGIPGGPINTVDQVFQHPQVQARGMVVEVPHPAAGAVRLVRSPLNLSRTPTRVRSHPPLVGEHTGEVLSRLLGYTEGEIRALRSEGVV